MGGFSVNRFLDAIDFNRSHIYWWTYESGISNLFPLQFCSSGKTSAPCCFAVIAVLDIVWLGCDTVGTPLNCGQHPLPRETWKPWNYLRFHLQVCWSPGYEPGKKTRNPSITCCLFKRNIQKSIIKILSENDETWWIHENDHQVKAYLLNGKPCFHSLKKQFVNGRSNGCRQAVSPLEDILEGPEDYWIMVLLPVDLKEGNCSERGWGFFKNDQTCLFVVFCEWRLVPVCCCEIVCFFFLAYNLWRDEFVIRSVLMKHMANVKK